MIDLAAQNDRRGVIAGGSGGLTSEIWHRQSRVFFTRPTAHEPGVEMTGGMSPFALTTRLTTSPHFATPPPLAYTFINFGSTHSSTLDAPGASPQCGSASRAATCFGDKNSGCGGLGFGVWDSGLGFGFWGSGFRGLGSGFRVSSFVICVLCFVFCVFCFVFCVSCFMIRVSSLGFGVPCFGSAT